MDIRPAIERFHLLISHHLATKVDRKLFCLKGGCNLRFYFRSLRYSEDIDFDVLTIQPQTLMKNVDKILGSPNLKSMLHHQGISINEWSKPKQTDTTQRWKLSLKIEGQTMAVPTKIEFSRRVASLSGALVEFVPSEITAAYKMQPVLLNHYSIKKAVEQKLGALQGRVESQARDVIDLKFLKDLLPGGLLDLELSEKQKYQCSEVLLSISYDDFMSQVWPYILVEYQDHYKNRAVWGAIQEEVLAFIQSLKVPS